VQNFNQWASRHEDGLDIDDLAYTLSMRRTMLDWRFAFVANQYKDIIGATQDVNANGSLQQISLEFRVAFLFTGQGAQWYAMGRELLMTYSRFRESIFTSASVLQELGASWYLVDELLLEEPETRINQSWLAQPACTAIQIALVDLLESIGVQPGVVLGHSSGEIAAAYTAGMLTQAAALRVAYHRGFVSGHRNTPMPQKGAMLAVGLSEDEALGHIRDVGCDDVCIACVNSPTSTTVSGNEASVLRLHDKLQSLSIFSRKLNVDTAYHSYHMQEASTTYLGRLNGLEVKSPLKSRRFISTVTALERISGFGPRYWVENLVSKVRYSDAILRHCHLEQGVDRPLRGRAKQIMIEIGPHATLAGPKRQTIQQKKGTFEYDYLPTLIRGTNALAAFLDLTGKLFERGYPLDLEMVNSMTLTKPHPVVTHNLPTYPWDHSHRHWYESRLSKQHRFRPHASHDLLGTRITSSTTLEPHWRHLIGIDILPWLQEHQVDDLVIFPAAAYICMVIEAARQLFVNSVCPRHYEIVLKTVSFSRALVVPPAPAKVELQLSLVRPMNFIGSDTSVHHEFRISALSSKEVWHEHCSGLVTVHHLELPADSLTSSTASELGHSCGELVSMIHADRTINVNLHDLYRDLKANGNYYGPCFAAIKRADIDNEVEMVTTVEIPDVAKVMPREYQRPHLIHPTTLDALMHSTVPLYISKKGPGSVMPTAIREFRISTMIDNAPGRHLRAETTLTPDGLVTANADVIVSESDRSNMPILRIFGVELRGFGRNPNNVSTHAQPHDNSFLMRWDVDPDFLSPSHLASLETVDTTTSPVTKTALLNRIASIYIKRSLAEPKTIGERSSEPHLLRLNDWMERHSLLSTKERLEDENEELSDVDLLLQVRQYGVEGRMLSRIGQNLTSILTGKIEPLGLMLEDDLLYHFYADESTNRCYGYLSRYLRYLGFKNPRMRILEIGAGTGSTTIPVLTTLNAEGASRMDHYHFTDISAGFFDKARVLLAEWRASVIFKRLDISHDPVSQGFGLHHYDLVIASNVLHATSSIEKTLSNVRRLLKPQGKLALIELTQPQSFLGLIFGTLHGWWQGTLTEVFGRVLDIKLHFLNSDIAIQVCTMDVKTVPS